MFAPPVTRSRGNGSSLVADQVTIDWDRHMLSRPRASGYAIAKDEDVLTNGSQTLYLPDGSTAAICYAGLDDHGRNKGAQAWVNRTSQSRTGFDGEYAKGGYPYMSDTPAGLHRGHLIARCLGGRGDIINWVPLKGPLNLKEWTAVESKLYDHINSERGCWVHVAITLEYKYDIPVPSSVTYAYELFKGKENVGKDRRVLDNHLEKDGITLALRRAWEG